jgi:sulfonate transport system substrate-binding protein
VRIGYQKSSVLVLLKWKGTLDTSLGKHGVRVEWAEFPTGPALLEALNAGQLDLGYVGEAPPIFGQAASPEMVYVAVDQPSPKSEAILVPRASPIATIADLKGKSVALNKGSNVHYFLVRALAGGGLTYRDVNIVYLPPADARAAFENGTIDAWAIWDPYLAAAEVTLTPRVLTTAEGLADNNAFYVARRAFADEHPELLANVLQHVRETDEWARQHRAEAAGHLGPLLGIEERAIQLSVGRASWGIGPVTETTLRAQQHIADVFLELGLLAQPLRVSEALSKSKPL